MSRVLFIASDKPLPLCDHRQERTKTVRVQGETFSLTSLAGFCVTEHGYYRDAVAVLGYPMKPFLYELELELCEEDLRSLKAYLREHFAAGETAELWNLWVGDDDLGRAPHYRGTLDHFDEDTLRQFLELRHSDGGLGQCRMSITV